MKTILLLCTTLFSTMVFAQYKIEVKSFENGLSYPVLTHPSDSNKYALINSEIYMGVKDLEESLYCVSDYGYVQKGNHLQLQIMCSCMEMDKGELRYFFFNLETGRAVKYSDLFEEKERDRAMKFIGKKIQEYTKIENSSCAESFGELDEDYLFDELNVKITREGIEIRVPDADSCEKDPLSISWVSLKEFLKYNVL